MGKSSSILGALVAVAMLASGCQSGTGTTGSSNLAWSENFQSAQAEAKKTGKLMMVDFNATWCGPCQQYKQDVFPTSEFGEIAKDFILVDIDIDQQQDLARKYEVGSIPDIRILDGDGKEVGKVVGFGGSEPLISELKRAKSTVTR